MNKRQKKKKGQTRNERYWKAKKKELTVFGYNLFSWSAPTTNGAKKKVVFCGPNRKKEVKI